MLQLLGRLQLRKKFLLPALSRRPLSAIYSLMTNFYPRASRPRELIWPSSQTKCAFHRQWEKKCTQRPWNFPASAMWLTLRQTGLSVHQLLSLLSLRLGTDKPLPLPKVIHKASDKGPKIAQQLLSVALTPTIPLRQTPTPEKATSKQATTELMQPKGKQSKPRQPKAKGQRKSSSSSDIELGFEQWRRGRMKHHRSLSDSNITRNQPTSALEGNLKSKGNSDPQDPWQCLQPILGFDQGTRAGSCNQALKKIIT